MPWAVVITDNDLRLVLIVAVIVLAVVLAIYYARRI